MAVYDRIAVHDALASLTLIAALIANANCNCYMWSIFFRIVPSFIWYDYPKYGQWQKTDRTVTKV